MVTTASIYATRAGAFGMKYTRTALKWIKQNWKGVTGDTAVTGAAIGGSLWIENELTDSEAKSSIQALHAEDLSDDEQDYALAVLKDTADDIKAGDIFVPFSERMNEYINPTHLIMHLQSARTWVTNNYISPAYVKAIKRNTVNIRSTFKKKRF